MQLGKFGVSINTLPRYGIE